MDLEKNAVRKGGQSVRMPLGSFRRDPSLVRHSLGLVLDLAEKVMSQYTFSYGWKVDALSFIILAHTGNGAPYVVKCTQVGAFRTMIDVYVMRPDYAVLFESKNSQLGDRPYS